jgi:hypothetical protein
MYYSPPLFPLSNWSIFLIRYFLFEKGKRVKRGGGAPSLLVSPRQPGNSLVYSIKLAGEGAGVRYGQPNVKGVIWSDKKTGRIGAGGNY